MSELRDVEAIRADWALYMEHSTPDSVPPPEWKRAEKRLASDPGPLLTALDRLAGMGRALQTDRDEQRIRAERAEQQLRQVREQVADRDAEIATVERLRDEWLAWTGSMPVSSMGRALDAALSLSVPTSPQTETLQSVLGLSDEQMAEQRAKLAADFDRIRESERRAALQPNHLIGTSPTEDDPPTFNQLLSDPTEQFDRRSELLPHVLTYLGVAEPDDRAAALMRSIEEYRHAPSNTASAPRYVPPSPTEDEPSERAASAIADDSGQYRWVCDCGAEWDWVDLSWITHEHREGPFWRRRTVSTEAKSYWQCVSRPVTWEDVPAVAAAVLASLTDTGDNKEQG